MIIDFFFSLSKLKIIELDKNLLAPFGLIENVRKNKSEEMNFKF